MLEKILIFVGILVGIAALIGLIKLLKFLFIATFANPVVNRIVAILLHSSRLLLALATDHTDEEAGYNFIRNYPLTHLILTKKIVKA